MKTTALTVVCGLAIVQQTYCQPENARSHVSRGNADSCVTHVVQTARDIGGRIITVTNSYTTIATGMNVQQADGSFVAADTEIQLNADGTADGQKTRHKIHLNADITDAKGLLTFVGPDPEGTEFVTRPLCISYFDASTGKSVLIGEFRSTIGALARGDNKVVYADCCADIKCNLIVQNTLSGVESWLEILENPPAPSEFGLNDGTTRLELITEFLKSPQPKKDTVVRRGSADDVGLTWGALRIPRGKAFKIGDANANSLPVNKQWGLMEGRQCLIENLDYNDIKPRLQQLRQANHASNNPNNGHKRTASLKRELPKRVAKDTSNSRLKLIASAAATKGFVLDYSIVSSGSGYTFQGGTTYLVTNAVYLGSPSTNSIILEGATVIKFSTNSDAQINFYSVDCQTAPYSPAILTSINDDTVGEQISGSTGNPSNDAVGAIALYCDYR